MQAPIANPLNLVASKPANSLPSLARSFELYSASSAASPPTIRIKLQLLK